MAANNWTLARTATICFGVADGDLYRWCPASRIDSTARLDIAAGHVVLEGGCVRFTIDGEAGTFAPSALRKAIENGGGGGGDFGVIRIQVARLGNREVIYADINNTRAMLARGWQVTPAVYGLWEECFQQRNRADNAEAALAAANQQVGALAGAAQAHALQIAQQVQAALAAANQDEPAALVDANQDEPAALVDANQHEPAALVDANQHEAEAVADANQDQADTIQIGIVQAALADAYQQVEELAAAAQADAVRIAELEAALAAANQDEPAALAAAAQATEAEIAHQVQAAVAAAAQADAVRIAELEDMLAAANLRAGAAEKALNAGNASGKNTKLETDRSVLDGGEGASTTSPQEGGSHASIVSV